MDLMMLAALCLVVGVGLLAAGAGYRLGFNKGGAEQSDEVRRLTADLVRAKAELADRQEYIRGLWSPKECRRHVFPREPVLRKNDQMKFLCQRCGEVRWTSKGA